MVVMKVVLYGEAWKNGYKHNPFAKAILEEGQEIYLGDVKGFTGAYDECDRIGHDTISIRARTEEWIKTGVMPPHKTNG